MTDQYDVIVIGSGAGGGTVTHALAPTGARVLLLERGGWLPREPENWSPAAVWADGRYYNSGEWTDLDSGPLAPVLPLLGAVVAVAVLAQSLWSVPGGLLLALTGWLTLAAGFALAGRPRVGAP